MFPFPVSLATVTEDQPLDHPDYPSDEDISFPGGPDWPEISIILLQGSFPEYGIMHACVDVRFLDQSGLVDYVIMSTCAKH